ncbi:Cas4-domain exonuclease [Phormidium phage Pf-WMP3]|uniref:PfWMP3_23 n=1 Tax=Phormidium phage Pf-WMP3 TaxID=2914005 RepID=A5HL37_9CAUD|nr:Cas4-domain exonuclease [Phormidium phage Pf-WMP3]ABQ12463.1 PfWMP3_23 [Phormidium phage Pf-WMP3]
MASITTFIEQYNNNELELEVTSSDYDAYTSAVRDSYRRQFVNERQQENRLRVSSLGKYAVVQALQCFGVHEDRGNIRGAQADMFHVGDITEARLIALMKAYGLQVTHEQHEVTWYGVLGHMDCVVDGMVIDVKAVNDGNFKRYQKKLSLTYLTQIGVYADALHYANCGVLLYNRNTCELALSVPDHDDIKEALERAEHIATSVKALDSVSDIWNYFDTPDPLEEVFQKQKTGRYYVPYDVRSPYDELLYETVSDVSGYGNERKYVLRYREPDEVQALYEAHYKLTT